MGGQFALEVRRVVPAPPETLYEAFTNASKLCSWWGPKGVRCVHAECDARVGGHYRIDNELPDGRVVVIRGEFLAVKPNRELVYTWSTDSTQPEPPERVTVRFQVHSRGTEIVILHERIRDVQVRDGHIDGWEGCLDGLIRWASG
jgi:uncharacterized protein YndB with AHSA1/START domain